MIVTLHARCTSIGIEGGEAANAEPSANLSPAFVTGRDKRQQLAGCGTRSSLCVAADGPKEEGRRGSRGGGITPDPELGFMQEKNPRSDRIV